MEISLWMEWENNNANNANLMMEDLVQSMTTSCNFCRQNIKANESVVVVADPTAAIDCRDSKNWKNWEVGHSWSPLFDELVRMLFYI